MGIRSRDAAARANTATNERNARRGVAAIAHAFVKQKTRRSSGVSDAAASDAATTTTVVDGGTRDGAVDGGARGGGTRASTSERVAWPDEAARADARRAAARGATTAAVDGEADDAPASTTHPPLETYVMYVPSESEGESSRDVRSTFERLSSVGAGGYIDAYDSDEDFSDDSNSEDKRALDRALEDLDFAQSSDNKCCCVVQ